MPGLGSKRGDRQSAAGFRRGSHPQNDAKVERRGLPLVIRLLQGRASGGAGIGDTLAVHLASGGVAAGRGNNARPFWADAAYQVPPADPDFAQGRWGDAGLPRQKVVAQCQRCKKIARGYLTVR